jgi:hypothetical protein
MQSSDRIMTSELALKNTFVHTKLSFFNENATDNTKVNFNTKEGKEEARKGKMLDSKDQDQMSECSSTGLSNKLLTFSVDADASIRRVPLHKPIISRKIDVPSGDQIPEGMPLPKPPILATLSQVATNDVGSLCAESVDNDEKILDDDSSTDKSTVCYSKIYESYEHRQQHHHGHGFSEYTTMNSDERIFLEAACALSAIGCGSVRVIDAERKEISQVPPRTSHVAAGLKQHPSSLPTSSSTPKPPSSTRGAIVSTNTSKKRRPLGPPPFALPKMRKSIVP